MNGTEGLNFNFIPDLDTPLDNITPRDFVSDLEEVDGLEDTNKSTEESPVKILAQYAKEKGLVNYNDEEFEDSEEFLNSLFNKSKQDAIMNEISSYKDSLPEKLKYLINSYEEGVPFHELLESEQRSSLFSTITDEHLEDESYQKDILSSFLSYQGFTDEEIENKLKQYNSAGLLKDEAKTALGKLKQIEVRNQQTMIEKAKTEKQSEINKYQEQLKNIENSILNMKEVLPGIELSDENKKAMIDMFTKPVDKVNGKPINKIQQLQMKDPNFMYKVAYAAMTNWDFAKKSESQALSKVKQQINSLSDEKSSLKLDAWRKGLKALESKHNIFKKQ